MKNAYLFVITTTTVLLAASVAARADVGIGVDLEASSVRAGPADAHAPFRVLDEDPATAWCEGKPDAGVGEGLTLTLPMIIDVQAVRFTAGGPKGDAAGAANRVTRLAVAVNGSSPVDVAVDGRGAGELRLSAFTPLEELEVRIGDAVPTRGNHSCIRGIEVQMANTRRVANFWLARDWEQRGPLEEAVHAVGGAFQGCAAEAFAAAVKLPLKVTPLPPNRGPVTYKTAAALAAACKDGLVPGLPAAAGVSTSLVERTVSVAPGVIVLDYEGMGRFRFQRAGEPAAWRLVEIVGDPG